MYSSCVSFLLKLFLLLPQFGHPLPDKMFEGFALHWWLQTLQQCNIFVVALINSSFTSIYGFIWNNSFLYSSVVLFLFIFPKHFEQYVLFLKILDGVAYHSLSHILHLCNIFSLALIYSSIGSTDIFLSNNSCLYCSVVFLTFFLDSRVLLSTWDLGNILINSLITYHLQGLFL